MTKQKEDFLIQAREGVVSVVYIFLLCVLYVGCSKAQQQNNPYTVEDTEAEYAPPPAYYEEQD